MAGPQDFTGLMFLRFMGNSVCLRLLSLRCCVPYKSPNAHASASNCNRELIFNKCTFYVPNQMTNIARLIIFVLKQEIPV